MMSDCSLNISSLKRLTNSVVCGSSYILASRTCIDSLIWSTSKRQTTTTAPAHTMHAYITAKANKQGTDAWRVGRHTLTHTVTHTLQKGKKVKTNSANAQRGVVRGGRWTPRQAGQRQQTISPCPCPKRDPGRAKCILILVAGYYCEKGGRPSCHARTISMPSPACPTQRLSLISL